MTFFEWLGTDKDKGGAPEGIVGFFTVLAGLLACGVFLGVVWAIAEALMSGYGWLLLSLAVAGCLWGLIEVYRMYLKDNNDT